MPAFLTLTLNPALDLSTTVEHIVESHKLRCDAPVVHPGGGGINVARVLRRLGADVLALATAGGSTGERLSRLLAAESVPAAYLPIHGETRESFTVRETASGREYRFVLPGPTLSEAEWNGFLDRVRERATGVRYVVASGGLAPGVPVDFYARLARLVRELGGRLVLDTAGPPLAAALEEGAWLIKPSLRELAGLAGHPLDTPALQLEAARELVSKGRAQAVALSLGPAGALLVADGGVAIAADALQVPVLSTVGAGDSFLASLLWSHDQGADWPGALRAGLAAGAAALSAPGTALCQPADIQRLAAQVILRPAS